MRFSTPTLVMLKPNQGLASTSIRMDGSLRCPCKLPGHDASIHAASWGCRREEYQQVTIKSRYRQTQCRAWRGWEGGGREDGGLELRRVAASLSEACTVRVAMEELTCVHSSAHEPAYVCPYALGNPAVAMCGHIDLYINLLFYINLL